MVYNFLIENWKSFLFFTFFIGMIFSLFFVFAYGGNPAEGFRTNHSTFSEVNASGLCIEVNNSHALNDYYVPSATYTELNSFYTNIPNGVTAVSCNSLPPRIAYYSSKVNQYTDPITGEWKTDEDCSSGASISNLTYCQDRYPETITYDVAHYAYEYIYDWRDTGGCGGSENLTKPTVRCRLCTLDYTYQTACESAGCMWHSYGATCGINYCWGGYSQQETCEAAGCYWNGQCYDGYSCENFLYYNECSIGMAYSEDPCGWDSLNGCCHGPAGACAMWNGLYSQCISAGCQYDQYDYCHEACN